MLWMVLQIRAEIFEGVFAFIDKQLGLFPLRKPAGYKDQHNHKCCHLLLQRTFLAPLCFLKMINVYGIQREILIGRNPQAVDRFVIQICLFCILPRRYTDRNLLHLLVIIE